MASFLKERFFRSLGMLHFFLELTGIFMSPLVSPPLWKRLLTKVWSVFLLVFCVQSNAYILLKRGCIFNSFIKCPQKYDGQIEYLTNTLIRVSQVLGDVTVQVAFVFTIQKTMTTFLHGLENIDNDFKRPSLVCVQRLSVIGLIFLIVTVSEMW